MTVRRSQLNMKGEAPLSRDLGRASGLQGPPAHFPSETVSRREECERCGRGPQEPHGKSPTASDGSGGVGGQGGGFTTPSLAL